MLLVSLLFVAVINPYSFLNSNFCFKYICNSSIIAASAIWKIKHKAEMANVVRGKAECDISIEAESRVLYFMYSTWQGNNLSVIKNFLNIHLPPLNIPSLPTLTINYIESRQTWFCSNTLLSYPVLKGLRKTF